MTSARSFGLPLSLARAAALAGFVGILVTLCGISAVRAESDDGLLRGDLLRVEMDQSRLMKLPEGVSTLVIGNPSIADGTLQGRGLMVLTGKSYGRTNLIALDREGAILLERELAVVRPTAGLDVVTVYRGPGGTRETLNCDERCEPSVTIGDGTDGFDATLKQINARNGLAAPQ